MREIECTAERMGRPAPRATPSIAGWTPIDAEDPIRLSEQTRDWNFEFTQLTGGDFNANGAALELDGVSVARMSISQTLLHRGFAPPNMVAVMLPGRGSGPVFAHGQLLEAGQCITLAEGAFLEAITHRHYVDIAFGFDMSTCGRQLGLLNGGSWDVQLNTTITAPGPAWIEEMGSRVEWLLAAVIEHPESLSTASVRASLIDHVLAAMVHFDNSPADVDSTTRAARASRRVAVRLAREFIHARLSEPLRLSELCRHARLKIRTLEYGFREVTGLTPVAYIRSVRLNAVRRALLSDASTQHRSISEIAMDVGFWHLSQFAVDYRLFFGETPTETRRSSGVTRRTVIRGDRLA
jgi:AraC family ethanolamine operon transcriptional activator